MEKARIEFGVAAVDAKKFGEGENQSEGWAPTQGIAGCGRE